MKCVFCKKIKNNDYLGEWRGVVFFEPLNPVTKGHLLFVPKEHVEDFTEDAEVSATVMKSIAQLKWKKRGSYNLITSKGKHATQTVKHLHIHLVPRHKEDNLKLPWS